MVNKQIEREQVLKPCLKLCKRLKQQGYIIKYRRLDALDSYHEPGDPDIEIWFIKDTWLWVLMVECKAPQGQLRPSQISYKNKYSGVLNTVYLIVRDPLDLKRYIVVNAENINFKPEQLEEMKEFNNA